MAYKSSGAVARLTIDKITLSNVTEMLRGLPKVVVADSVRRIMRQAGNVVRKAVQPATPVKTGALKKSFKVKSLKRSRTIERVGVRVASYPAAGERFYAAMVEYGWNPEGGTTKSWRAEGERYGNLASAHRRSLKGRRVPGKLFFSSATQRVSGQVNFMIARNAEMHIIKAVEKYQKRNGKRGKRRAA